MIKHGPIQQVKETGIAKATLQPIHKFITKGIADAKQDIILQPMACDVKGAKRFNGQQCVIAKCLTRTMHPEAVAVGRSLAYAVFNGLAVRFAVPIASRRLVEEFDQRGKATNAPIALKAVSKSWRLTKRIAGKKNDKAPSGKKVKRTKHIGVRAAFGGVSSA